MVAEHLQLKINPISGQEILKSWRPDWIKYNKPCETWYQISNLGSQIGFLGPSGVSAYAGGSLANLGFYLHLVFPQKRGDVYLDRLTQDLDRLHLTIDDKVQS